MKKIGKMSGARMVQMEKTKVGPKLSCAHTCNVQLIGATSWTVLAIKKLFNIESVSVFC